MDAESLLAVLNDAVPRHAEDIHHGQPGIPGETDHVHVHCNKIAVDQRPLHVVLGMGGFDPDLVEESLQAGETGLGQRTVLQVLRRKIAIDLARIECVEHLAVHFQHQVQVALFLRRTRHHAPIDFDRVVTPRR